MDVTYKVVRVSPHPVEQEVTLANGEKEVAIVPSIEVEMVPVSHDAAGTVKLTYTGSDRAAAASRFAPGDLVVAAWSTAAVTRSADADAEAKE